MKTINGQTDPFANVELTVKDYSGGGRQKL
jgi:hypothetical protein